MRDHEDLNLLVFNLAMDVNHTALGFATAWVNALARRSRHVSVITMTSGKVDVEPNVSVYSLGKERGWSEPRRAVEFYRLVARVLRERDVDACFAHQAPTFAAMFAPIAKLRGIPILLWYAHGARPLALRVAHRLVDRCVTSTPHGFRIPSSKLFVIGQGIDTEGFRPPTAPGTDYDRTLISIGRLTRTKRIDEMLESLAVIRNEHGLDLRLELVGEPMTDEDRAYVEALQRATDSLGIGDAVRFAGRVPFEQVASSYQQGSVFINLSQTGSLDKAVLESMASGCVPVSRNDAFRALASKHGLESLVPGPDAHGVAASVVAAVRMDPEQRSMLVARLRAIVEEKHGLDAMRDKLLEHMAELAA